VLTLEHLQLFRDIAQTRSISRGAQLNDVSQSAASQHIQELEKQVEVMLVDRSTRPLNLTQAGKLYYEFCKEVLRRKREFENALEGLKGRVEGTVRVASIYSVGLSEMSRLEQEFSQRHPGAELYVDYLRPEKVYEAVLEERADLGLVSYPEASKQIKVIPWREERMVVAVAPTHELASYPRIALPQLEGKAFVGFDEDLPISREVRKLFRDAQVNVEEVMHFDNIQMMKEAVALGSGFSILPDRILQSDVEHGRIIIIPLEEPGLRRPVGIVHLKRKKLSRATASFLNLLTEENPGAQQPRLPFAALGGISSLNDRTER
jgi:DNA-binding transcriptional LysR family regulator